MSEPAVRTVEPARIRDFGRYNLLLELGKGGMGTVFLARQKSLKRFCALKVVDARFSSDTAAIDRLVREAQASASLSHPNLALVFDCDQFQGQYFIGMEYVDGRGLGDVLRQHGALPLPLALDWLRQAAEGLAYIHGKQIVHRDIKPENLMVNAQGVIKIMDLGLAKTNFERDKRRTLTGSVMGSPYYMSPEQIREAKLVDHRTDIYSLGITFFHMIVGKPPYQRMSTVDVYVAHLTDAMPSVNLSDQHLTRALDPLIGKMTAKEKEQRFPSAADLLAAIQPLLGAFPLDIESSDFLAKLKLEDCNVERVLDRTSVDRDRMDAELGNLDGAHTTFAAPPATRRRRAALWLAASGVIALLIAANLYFLVKQRSYELKREGIQSTPLAAVPAASGTLDPQRLQPHISLLLDMIRETSAAEWPSQKKLMLSNLAERVRQQSPTDPAAQRRALDQIGDILDDAKALPDTEFAIQKPLLITMIRQAITNAGEKKPADKPPAAK